MIVFRVFFRVDEFEFGIRWREGVLVFLGSGVEGVGFGGVGWVEKFIFLGFLLVIDIILRRERYILNYKLLKVYIYLYV